MSNPICKCGRETVTANYESFRRKIVEYYYCRDCKVEVDPNKNLTEKLGQALDEYDLDKIYGDEPKDSTSTDRNGPVRSSVNTPWC